MSDLFEESGSSGTPAPTQPLAARMRPQCIGDLVGQEHLLAEGRLLRRAIEADRLGSIILYGPPGCGKTSLAEVISDATRRTFERTSGVLANVAILRSILQTAEQRRAAVGRETILFIDEIHRFNKAQQDVLLPYVEEGAITLIGATTHNPFFFINTPLTSRSQIFQLEPLNEVAIVTLLQRAIERDDVLRGLNVLAGQAGLQHLAAVCDGDARKALNAAIYWLAKMLYAGEDPRFIARRLIILASEDIGNADPRGLSISVSAMEAVEFVGMPEARIILAQATTYLATAPKSNASYKAIDEAMRDIKEGRTLPVPLHLRSTSYKGSERLGHGGYNYAHDHPGHVVEQVYVPTEKIYYSPTKQGYEEIIGKRLEHWATLRASAKPPQTDKTP